MGDGSPLFHSALELLAHSCEHYVGNQESDRRLVILHLANAVELLLKDRLLDLGISIYEKPKQTKSINRVFSDLEKEDVAIPAKHILELLVDERNNIQHRFGSPNSMTVKYYFDNSLKFFEEFMNSAFGLELREYLSNLLDDGVLKIIYPESETSQDVLQQARLVARVHPSSSIVTAWMEVEKKVDALRAILGKETKKISSWMLLPVSSFMRHLVIECKTTESDIEGLRKEIVSLSQIRNRIVHADTEASDTDARQYIERVERLMPKMDELKAELLVQMKSHPRKASKKPSSKTRKKSDTKEAI